MKTLVFDIGGTNIRFAVATGKKLGQPVLRLVPKNYTQAVQLISDVAKSFGVNTIIGGLPGTLNTDRSKLLHSTHLSSWAGRPILHELQRATGTKVFLENDSALVALGEAVVGAGQGYAIAAYIGFGTGIGGARIVDGRIDANAKGFEPGHHIIDWNVRSHRHPSPHPGAWESFVSGSGILFTTGKKAETITDKKIWRQAEERAAIGLINVSMFWSPEVIILGGSLMKKMSLTEIRSHYRKRQHIFPHPPLIKKALLGDWSGLYGALAMARQKFLIN